MPTFPLSPVLPHPAWGTSVWWGTWLGPLVCSRFCLGEVMMRGISMLGCGSVQLASASPSPAFPPQAVDVAPAVPSAAPSCLPPPSPAPPQCSRSLCTLLFACALLAETTGETASGVSLKKRILQKYGAHCGADRSAGGKQLCSAHPSRCWGICTILSS